MGYMNVMSNGKDCDFLREKNLSKTSYRWKGLSY